MYSKSTWKSKYIWNVLKYKYLSTSTSTYDFSEMYLNTFQVLYKLYLSTDVLKYKVLLPGSATEMFYRQ